MIELEFEELEKIIWTVPKKNKQNIFKIMLHKAKTFEECQILYAHMSMLRMLNTDFENKVLEKLEQTAVCFSDFIYTYSRISIFSSKKEVILEKIYSAKMDMNFLELVYTIDLFNPKNECDKKLLKVFRLKLKEIPISQDDYVLFFTEKHSEKDTEIVLNRFENDLTQELYECMQKRYTSLPQAIEKMANNFIEA